MTLYVTFVFKADPRVTRDTDNLHVIILGFTSLRFRV